MPVNRHSILSRSYCSDVTDANVTSASQSKQDLWKSLTLNKGYPFSKVVTSIMQLHYLLIGALFLLYLIFSFFLLQCFWHCFSTGSKSAWESVLIVLHSAHAAYQCQCLSVDMTNIAFWKDNVSPQWVYPEQAAKI